MAIVLTDWQVTRATGDIRYIGADHGGVSPSYATVIQFHRWLQSLADDALASGDDQLDITNTDPSRRSTDNIITLINGYNITAVEAEHLYDGSIIQGTAGSDIWDGIVNFGNASVQLQIIQDGAVLTDDWWNFAGGGLNPSAAAGISHRFMIKTRTAGVDIDGRRLIGTCRRFGYTYSEFGINGTSRGNNVLALADSIDLNNTTIAGTVAGWTTIVNSLEGYNSIDVNNDGTPENYYSSWDKATYTINQFYERQKWLTRDGSASTIYGLSGELFRGITHQIVIGGTRSGTWVQPEKVTWAGGEGQLLAVNSTAGATTTMMYIQLLKGVVPVTQTITGANGAIGTSGTVTERTVSKPYCGASTGSAIIGAYGFGIEVADLTANDKVTSLADVVITPPNYVQNTVGGLVSGEDRVLVAPWNGSSYDSNGDPAITKNQLLTSVALTTAAPTAVVVSTAIPADTPASGYIRLTDNNGFERRIHYTSWTGSTFTIDSGDRDFSTVGASSGNSLYIAYIDVLASGTSASFTSVQSGTRQLVVIVRDGGTAGDNFGIKQFISAWSQTSSPQTITAIRTSDV